MSVDFGRSSVVARSHAALARSRATVRNSIQVAYTASPIPPALRNSALTPKECCYSSGQGRDKPTQRIRSLEAKLRNLRTALDRLQNNNGGLADSDTTGLLQTLDLSIVESENCWSSSDEDARQPQLTSMLTPSGNIIVTRSQKSNFYGPGSGASFILRTLELFRKPIDDDSFVTEAQEVVNNLFDKPAPSPGVLPLQHTHPPSHPNQTTALRLLDAVFTKYHALIQFLHESDFRDMVRRLYSEPLLWASPSTGRFMPLFHSVLALGFHLDIESRNSHGCQFTDTEALKNFQLASRDVDVGQCSDLISLQTILCLVVFLLSTSSLTAAHTYLGMACSLAWRLGLHKDDHKLLYTQAQRSTRSRVLLGVLQLDMLVSLVLDIPPTMNHDSVDPGAMEKVRCPVSFTTRESTTSTLIGIDTTVAASRHFQILALTSSARRNVFSAKKTRKKKTQWGAHTECVNVKALDDVEQKFKKWANAMSGLSTIPLEPDVSVIVRYELEMAFYFGQLTLNIPFLHYLIPMANGSPITRIQSQHALTCLKIAATTISRTDAMHQRGLLSPGSWTTTYTLFLAVVCLMFLVAAHNGTSRPSEAWKKGELGIRLLAGLRCTDNPAARSLSIIKMVIKQLEHTVSFDVDQILASTPCPCKCSLMGLERVATIDRLVSGGGLGPSTVPDGGVVAASTSGSLPMYPSLAHQWTGPALDGNGLPAWYTQGGANAPLRDIDSILAEAQAIPLTIPMI
ncbi:hypothetical protein ABEF93_005699 [Exophiala dermatitidis]